MSCNPPATPAHPQESPCLSLDTLLQHVDNARIALEEGRSWAECANLLEPVLDGLRQNMRRDTGECNYLNMKKFPDRDRMLFVDLLRDRTETDTIHQGIYFLLHLRGIFDQDEAFSEFFAEELAHVAHNNPHCFQAYLNANPDQEVMLLYSTKWNRLDLDTLIHRYGRIDSGGTVVKYLSEQKEKFDSGT